MCVFFAVTKLPFVLKLDECQIVKGRRLERMSIMLMKEAMDVAFSDNMGIPIDRIKPTFSVQLERDIWLLGAFEVPNETHEMLANLCLNEFHGLAT